MSTIRFYCVICGAALAAPADSHYDLTKCHACARHVPVPRPVNLLGDFTRYQAVFPASVLELSVTFNCGECGSRLRADARREGRKIICPICSGTTDVPRWSTVPMWRPQEAAEKARGGASRLRGHAGAATLSAEEIAFLRGGASGEAV